VNNADTVEERKYTQDGVNVVEGDTFSRFAGSICKATYENSPYIEVRDFSRGHFRGPRGFRLKGLPADCWLDAAPDGDGTKVVLVDAAGDYDNAAYGWIAMTCGDITRWGGIPLVLVNTLDTETIGKLGQPVNNAFRAMIAGVQRIAAEQQLVMLKGETAELPGCVTSPNEAAFAKYLWSGVAIGAYNPRTIITGDKIQEGMAVMALRERGLRNNGISSARKAIVMAFGSLSCLKAQEAVKMAATPAVLYDKFLATANGWFAEDFKPIIPMYLIVHLTGGALKSKFAEDILFPRGLSAYLDKLWEPPEIMRQCAQWRGMDDEECYETWHGGQGVLVVIDAADEAYFISLAGTFGIEARRAGKITKEDKPTVVIESKFNGKTIPWSAK
jgi:phosphoribosylformylglycinamidine cyclo-ligase